MTDGCLAKNYLPDPPRLWERTQTNCNYFYENVDENGMIFFPYFNKNVPISKVGELKQMLYKGIVLQYPSLSTKVGLTKKMNYAKIAQKFGNQRKKTWATQSDSYTSPNTNLLRRRQYSITSNNLNGEIQIPECIKPKIEKAVFPLLSDPSYSNSIFPPSNDPVVKSSYDYPMTPNIPILNNSVVEGGKLHHRTQENICTGTNTECVKKMPCFPTSASDVPGPIIQLCYPSNFPVFYPRVRRTYAPTITKPINNSFIPAYNEN